MAARTLRIGRLALPPDLGGVFVNALLRVLLVAFTIDSLLNAGDERFAGKALGPRNLIILFGFSLLFPVLHRVLKQWKTYPWWFDALFLSIFFVDMAGNSADLYNKVEWFDHVSHSFGPGALAVVLMGAFAVGPLAAAGFSTMLHTQLEIQEIYGDQFLGTHNVRDIMDTANDLLFGIVGATVFVLVYKGTEWYQRKRAQPRRVRQKRT